jgi:hypothetical protein
MSNVDENANEIDSIGEDLIMLNEPYEDEVKHDPFEFSDDDKILFSRLLYNSMVWQVQRFDNGDANSNMPLLDDDVKMSYAPPPSCTCSNGPKSRNVHAINGFHGRGPPN